MTLRPKRAALRERRKQLQRSYKARLQQARQRLARLPHVQEAKARKRRLLALVVLLVLVCVSRCTCTTPTPPPPSAPQPALPVIKIRALPPKPKPSTPRPKTPSLPPRGRYQADPPSEPAWVEAFRLQVAARSRRLSQCFSGAAKPGALRWTAAINPDTGAVSDQKLEALPPSDDLTPAQRVCVVQVLSTPRYASLVAAQAQSLPDNVSLVLEF